MVAAVGAEVDAVAVEAVARALLVGPVDEDDVREAARQATQQVVVRRHPRPVGEDGDHDNPRHGGELAHHQVEVAGGDRPVRAQRHDDRLAEPTLGPQPSHLLEPVDERARDCTASTQNPAAARLGAAPNITESPSAYRSIGVARHGSAGGGGAATVVVGATVVVVVAAATVVVGSTVVATTTGRSVVVVEVVVVLGADAVGPRRGAAAKGSPVERRLSSWAAAISFGRTSAMARLAPAKPATAIAAATVAGERPPDGERPQPLHAAATLGGSVPRRIGVSINRYDTSVTTAEMTTAVTNSTTDNGRPATPRIAW